MACCDRNHTALVPTVMIALTGIIRSPGSCRDKYWLPTDANRLGSLRLKPQQNNEGFQFCSLSVQFRLHVSDWLIN